VGGGAGKELNIKRKKKKKTEKKKPDRVRNPQKEENPDSKKEITHIKERKEKNAREYDEHFYERNRIA